ncbi:MAG: acyltransferase [Flavobacteriales bacterium]
MLKKILRKCKSILVKKPFPSMVYGFKRADGIKVENVRISNSTFIDHKHKLKIGNNVFIGHFNFIEASNGITIEEGCQITNYVSITSHSSHDSIRLYGKDYGGKNMKGYVKGEVFIGKYSFIGPHVTIMPNTKIGKGSIVASHSFIKGEFPDFSILAGNPAKIIGDTREKDAEIIAKNPELKVSYDEWIKR